MCCSYAEQNVVAHKIKWPRNCRILGLHLIERDHCLGRNPTKDGLCEILEEVILPHINALFGEGHNLHFAQDNATIHTSRATH